MSRKLKIIFMGTPDFAVPALEKLIASHHDVIAIYTQPPRPRGRGQQVKNSSVHDVAIRNDIPVFTPRSLKKDEQARREFLMLNADIAIVAAYGLILPKDILEGPKFGCLNIHGSLLPRWRGASPIQHAIWKGDSESGNCIMKMEEGLDTGPVILRRAVPIRPQTTSASLYNELGSLGAVMIHEVVDYIAVAGTLPPLMPQDDALSTYAPMLKKEDGLIDWGQTAQQIDCQIRGLNPWPGVFTFNDGGQRLKALAAIPADIQCDKPPGTMLDRHGHVSCGDKTVLKLIKVQPDNAKSMDIAAALNGHYIAEGIKFGALPA